jgi:hypothetical protein
VEGEREKSERGKEAVEGGRARRKTEGRQRKGRRWEMNGGISERGLFTMPRM